MSYLAAPAPASMDVNTYNSIQNHAFFARSLHGKAGARLCCHTASCSSAPQHALISLSSYCARSCSAARPPAASMTSQQCACITVGPSSRAAQPCMFLECASAAASPRQSHFRLHALHHRRRTCSDAAEPPMALGGRPIGTPLKASRHISGADAGARCPVRRFPRRSRLQPSRCSHGECNTAANDDGAPQSETESGESSGNAVFDGPPIIYVPLVEGGASRISPRDALRLADLHGSKLHLEEPSKSSSSSPRGPTAQDAAEGVPASIDRLASLTGLEDAAVATPGEGGQEAEDREPLESRALRRKGLNSMYVGYTLACLLERTWRFAQPLLLTQLGGGIAAVVQLQFLGQLAAVLSIPAVGTRLDTIDRVALLRWATLVQNCTIGLSAAAVAFAYQCRVTLDISAGLDSVQAQLFIALALLTMAEKLAALAFDVSVERDWVVALTGLHRHADLAETNSMLRRIDQFSEAIGSALFGALFVATKSWSLAVVVLFSVLITPLQQRCHTVSITCYDSAEVLTKRAYGEPDQLPSDSPPHCSSDSTASAGASHSSHKRSAKQSVVAALKFCAGLPSTVVSSMFVLPMLGLRNTIAAVRTLKGLTVLPVSMSFTVCFFNVALGPGAIMTAFLSQQGATAQAIAFIRSIGGFTAFGAMLIATKLVSALGVLNAGLAACAFHSIGVALAGFVYWLFFAPALPPFLAGIQDAAAQALPWVVQAGPMETAWGLWGFAMLANLARAGVWVFEIIETSIFQTATPARVMVTASAAEAAIQSMAELSLLGLAAIGLGGHNALVMISQAAALLSLLIYLWWLLAANGRTQYHASILEHSGLVAV